jgi:hypothetical protein
MNSTQRRRFRTAWRMAAFSLALVAATAVGCSGNNLSSVKGKVMAFGKPVTAGTLIFAPVRQDSNPGASASVLLKSDGTFESGSVVPPGTCKVTYVAPAPAYPEGHVPKPSEPAPLSPFSGLVAKVKDVAIKPGHNTIDLELVRAGR